MGAYYVLYGIYIFLHYSSQRAFRRTSLLQDFQLFLEEWQSYRSNIGKVIAPIWAKLSLQFHLNIDLPFSTVELRFTVILDQAKSLPVAISAFHVVCTVIILIKAHNF